MTVPGKSSYTRTYESPGVIDDSLIDDLLWGFVYFAWAELRGFQAA